LAEKVVLGDGQAPACRPLRNLDGAAVECGGTSSKGYRHLRPSWQREACGSGWVRDSWALTQTLRK
jgi:hypothetical protein